MVLGLLFHVTPSNFFRWILRSEALVYKSYLNLMSVVRIGESPYYGVFFFLGKYMRIFSGQWKLSVLERCRYREVLFFFETATLNNKTKSKAPVSQLMDEFDKCRSQQDPHNGTTLVCRRTWQFVRRSQGCVLLTSTNEQK